MWKLCSILKLNKLIFLYSFKHILLFGHINEEK